MRAVEKRLRERIKYLEVELGEVTVDRQKFRDYFSSKLRWFITLMGENKYADTAPMIEDLAKLLQRVKWFTW